MSNSLRPYGPESFRLLCPWNSPGKNTGVGYHASPGNLPDPGIEPLSLPSPGLVSGFFTTSATWELPSRWEQGKSDAKAGQFLVKGSSLTHMLAFTLFWNPTKITLSLKKEKTPTTRTKRTEGRRCSIIKNREIKDNISDDCCHQPLPPPSLQKSDRVFMISSGRILEKIHHIKKNLIK